METINFKIELYSEKHKFFNKMDSNNECPICFKTYGYQYDDDDEDEYFLCKDGKNNSDISENCKHYICVECCEALSEQIEINCPLCREDWTDWIHSRY